MKIRNCLVYQSVLGMLVRRAAEKYICRVRTAHQPLKAPEVGSSE